MNIQDLLHLTIASNASDLHLSTGNSPVLRIDGDLQVMDQPSISPDVMTLLLQQILTTDQADALEHHLEIDFAYSLSDTARFRVNLFRQARGYGAAFRVIPNKIPTLADLNMPDILKELVKHQNGLVLVTGPTGSGKSTTLAAMVDHLNKTTKKHIITVEDPIEFTHSCQSCLINQRELHRDTKSFANALRSSLREDPDIILVGELRDLETIHLALTAAETGHLVLATLHTNSAAKTIDRLIDVFPGGEKDMIRSMLSESLRAIVAQTLVKRVNGGRVAAQEILIANPAIRNLIREHKIPQIVSCMQTNQSAGMQTMAKHLEQLLMAGIIDAEAAPGVQNPALAS